MSGLVTFVGHATVCIELDGFRFVTDPVFRRRVGPLGRTAPLPPLPDRLDAVLVSHGHFDHLDLPSLARLGDVPVVCPRGLGALLGRRVSNVSELAPGEELDLGEVSVRATHAEHGGGRPPFRPRAGAVGYALLGTRRIYFAGDTDLFPGLERLVPELDLALLPVTGWGARVGAGHLDPERAAEAARRLAPRVAVPIHWGTYAPGGRLWRRGRTPALDFAAAVTRVAPSVAVRILDPGGGERLVV